MLCAIMTGAGSNRTRFAPHKAVLAAGSKRAQRLDNADQAAIVWVS